MSHCTPETYALICGDPSQFFLNVSKMEMPATLLDHYLLYICKYHATHCKYKLEDKKGVGVSMRWLGAHAHPAACR